MAAITLKNVVDELKANREVGEQSVGVIGELTNAISNFMQSFSDQSNRDRLQAEEDRRERRALPSPSRETRTVPGAPDAGLGLLGTIFGGSFLSGLALGLIKNVATPLRFIAGLVTKNGPLVLAIGAMVYLFKDITENPLFQETMTNLRVMWNDKLVPLFNKLSNLFTDIGESEGFEEFYKFLGSFGTHLQEIFQNLLLSTVDVLVNVIGGVSESISLFAEGEFFEGMKNLLKTLLIGFGEAIDAALSFVVGAIGFDLGPEGSLALKIVEFGTNVLQWFKDGFETIRLFFMEEIPRWFFETKEFLVNKFFETIESVKNTIIEKFNEFDIAGKIRTAIEVIQNKFDEILQSFKDMVDYVAGIPERITSYIASILPDWMRSDGFAPTLGYDPLTGKSFTPDDRTAETAVNPSYRTNLVGPQAMIPRSAETLRSETEAYLKSLQAPQSNNLMVTQDNRQSSSVSTTNTNISTWSSPMNEYSPQ